MRRTAIVNRQSVIANPPGGCCPPAPPKRAGGPQSKIPNPKSKISVVHLTVRERLLLYLMRFASIEAGPSAPRDISQEGIAAAVSIQRSHVHRAAAALEREGLLCISKARVDGTGRRRTVYLLTWEGLQSARGVAGRFGHLDGEAVGRGVPLPDLLIELSTGVGPRGASCPELPVHPDPVGRERETAWLRSWANGTECAAAVTGPPGIGKTALASAFVRDWLRNGHAGWLAVRGWEGWKTLMAKFGTLLSAVGRPRLSAFLSAPSAGSDDAIALLVDEGRGLPLLLVVDDFHRAGNGLRRAVGTLARLPSGRSGTKILILSRRPVNGAGSLSLGELGPAPSRSLCAASDEARWRRIHALAGGHPLLLRLLASAPGAPSAGTVRGYIRDEVMACLTPSERRMLRVAAHLDGSASAPAATSLAGEGSVRRLMAMGLIESDAAGRLRVPEYLRGYLGPERSASAERAVHLLAARLSAALPEGGSVLLAAIHLSLGGRPVRGLRLLCGRFDHVARACGAEGVERAVGLILQSGTAGAAAKTMGLLLKGRCALLQGKWTRAIGFMRKAGAALPADLLHTFHLARGRAALELGLWEEAARHLGAALKECGRAGDRLGMADASCGLGDAAWQRGRWGEARRWFRRSDSALSRAPPSVAAAAGEEMAAALDRWCLLRARSLTGQGNILLRRGSARAAIRRYRAALKLLREGNWLYEAPRLYNNLGTAHFFAGEARRAASWFRRCIREARAIRNAKQFAYGLYNLGELHARAGRVGGARRCLEGARAIFGRMGDRFMLASVLMAEGILYRETGDHRTGADRFGECLRLLRTMGRPYDLAEAHREYAVLLERMGRAGEAAYQNSIADGLFRRGASSPVSRTSAPPR